MSQTGVLPFLRGIDFTKYNFSNKNHPKLLLEMERLRWIKLNNTDINNLPIDLFDLKKLEHLQIKNNNLIALREELVDLNCLRVLNARKNHIKNENIPPNLNKLQDLSVLDLSFNDLNEFPLNLEEIKALSIFEKIPHFYNYLQF